MTGGERRRRVVLLCCSFARNLAFYHAGQSTAGRGLISAAHPQASFWRQANANFLDMCVLEWCKLMADKKGKHFWGRVVADPAQFAAGLHRHVGMNSSAFDNEIRVMRDYRDRFIAHLDDELVMDIPVLDAAQAAVWFYHAQISTREARIGELSGLPDTPEKLNDGYEKCIKEAKSAFPST
jgi:hypothetical protein